ncbi:hypothetical protein B0H67DRAFT_548392 [Lasiosphaeris hirsuta]|uniref:Uncharacterized protein n=1 Tax=Lasiosphaeris hirsuta TaxID=260670 RepID=A0AA40BA46_9PEZI|nr:hypothetical protein B0H67DRAFT_548392 [Lasiosphaeris hirsuta]
MASFLFALAILALLLVLVLFPALCLVADCVFVSRACMSSANLWAAIEKLGEILWVITGPVSDCLDNLVDEIVKSKETWDENSARLGDLLCKERSQHEVIDALNADITAIVAAALRDHKLLGYDAMTDGLRPAFFDGDIPAANKKPVTVTRSNLLICLVFGIDRVDQQIQAKIRALTLVLTENDELIQWLKGDKMKRQAQLQLLQRRLLVVRKEEQRLEAIARQRAREERIAEDRRLAAERRSASSGPSLDSMSLFERIMALRKANVKIIRNPPRPALTVEEPPTEFPAMAKHVTLAIEPAPKLVPVTDEFVATPAKPTPTEPLPAMAEPATLAREPVSAALVPVTDKPAAPLPLPVVIVTPPADGTEPMSTAVRALIQAQFCLEQNQQRSEAESWVIKTHEQRRAEDQQREKARAEEQLALQRAQLEARRVQRYEALRLQRAEAEAAQVAAQKAADATILEAWHAEEARLLAAQAEAEETERKRAHEAELLAAQEANTEASLMEVDVLGETRPADATIEDVTLEDAEEVDQQMADVVLEETHGTDGKPKAVETTETEEVDETTGDISNEIPGSDEKLKVIHDTDMDEVAPMPAEISGETQAAEAKLNIVKPANIEGATLMATNASEGIQNPEAEPEVVNPTIVNLAPRRILANVMSEIWQEVKQVIDEPEEVQFAKSPQEIEAELSSAKSDFEMAKQQADRDIAADEERTLAPHQPEAEDPELDEETKAFVAQMEAEFDAELEAAKSAANPDEAMAEVPEISDEDDSFEDDVQFLADVGKKIWDEMVAAKPDATPFVPMYGAKIFFSTASNSFQRDFDEDVERLKYKYKGPDVSTVTPKASPKPALPALSGSPMPKAKAQEQPTANPTPGPSTPKPSTPKTPGSKIGEGKVIIRKRAAANPFIPKKPKQPARQDNGKGKEEGSDDTVMK